MHFYIISFSPQSSIDLSWTSFAISHVQCALDILGEMQACTFILTESFVTYLFTVLEMELWAYYANTGIIFASW